MVRIAGDLVADWDYLDERIDRVTDEIEDLAQTDVSCAQLVTVPGVGPIIASATVAAIGNGAAFANGRDFAAWLGLVPKQMSTGDRTILGRITKRGNRYLRMLFIQGARAVLLHPTSWAKHSFGSWLTAAARRLHCNVLTVALANKLARIALTVLFEGRKLRNARRTGTGTGLIKGKGCLSNEASNIDRHRQHRDCCRGLRVGLRSWRNGFTVASAIWWHVWHLRALTRMRSDACGYP
jgi:Transposase IS116/IS110/IS902 family